MLTIEERSRRAAEEAMQFFLTAPPFEVLEENRMVFEPIYPLAAHAIEQVKAALVLIDAGLSYPAEANARSALQHAVTAQWVLFTAGGEEAALEEMRRNHSATLNDLARSVELPTDLIAGLQRGPTSDGPARRFWQMCDRFSEEKALYVLYRRLSDAVHPSLRTLTHHLQSDAKHGIIGLDATSPSEPDSDLLLALAFSAMFAVSAVESLRRDQPRLPDVIAIANRWEVPVDLEQEDRQPGLRRP